MEWSPKDAMQAYLHTIHLCKQSSHETTNNKAIEPKCAEFVSALAAGKRARMMVEVAAGDIPTPLTVALAAAAKQTGGRLVCVLVRPDNHKNSAEAARARLGETGLAAEVIECNENPCHVIDKFEGVDFAALDCKIGDHNAKELYKSLKLNPNGSTVVAYNNNDDDDDDFSPVRGNNKRIDPFLDVLKLAGKGNGVESHVTLPLVGEFGRLGLGSKSNGNLYNNDKNSDGAICKGLNKSKTKRYRRFYVTIEN